MPTIRTPVSSSPRSFQIPVRPLTSSWSSTSLPNSRVWTRRWPPLLLLVVRLKVWKPARPRQSRRSSLRWKPKVAGPCPLDKCDRSNR